MAADSPTAYRPSMKAGEAGGAASGRGPLAVADRCAKRVVDIAVSTVLLVVLLPVIAAVALAIKLDSPGPVFYRCRRAGFRGRSFGMLKFRKMRDDASGPALTVAADVRFTRLGAFLATTKLDEVPQLWNVLKGEMSLVGPRPEDESFVALHRDAYDRILSVRPGVTGLCQLAFAKEGRILDPRDRVTDYVQRLLPQKVRIDELYAARRSLAMDLRILAWTAIAVLARKDVAVDRQSGALTLRRRPGSRLRPAAHKGESR